MSYKRLNIFFLLIIAWLPILSISCGYHFAGSGKLPGNINTIYVSVLKNNTSETGFEITLTNDLIYELTRNNRDVLQKKTHADAILTGSIKFISNNTISRKEQNTSVERRISITIDLCLNSKKEKLLWNGKEISETEVFTVVDGDKQATELNKKSALSTLSKRLAENIRNRLTDDF